MVCSHIVMIFLHCSDYPSPHWWYRSSYRTYFTVMITSLDCTWYPLPYWTVHIHYPWWRCRTEKRRVIREAQEAEQKSKIFLIVIMKKILGNFWFLFYWPFVWRMATMNRQSNKIINLITVFNFNFISLAPIEMFYLLFNRMLLKNHPLIKFQR